MVTATPTPVFRLNFGEAFTFLFHDPHWLRKFGLAALFSLFGFLVLPYIFVLGYLLTTSERVARLEGQALPEWSDFGALLRKGWRVVVVRIVYFMPIWLIIVIVIGLITLVIFSLGGFSLFAGTSSPAPMSLAPLWLLVLIIPLALLSIPLGLLIPCILPAADAQLVLHEGQLEPAFRFGAVFSFIRRNFGQYVLAVIVYYGATRVLSGGMSMGFQFSGNLGGPDRLGLVFLALLGGFTLIAWLVTTVVTLYLRCFMAHMVGQLCWHETTAGGDGR